MDSFYGGAVFGLGVRTIVLKVLNWPLASSM